MPKFRESSNISEKPGNLSEKSEIKICKNKKDLVSTTRFLHFY